MHEASEIVIKNPVGTCKYSSENCIPFLKIFLHPSDEIICQRFNSLIPDRTVR